MPQFLLMCCQTAAGPAARAAGEAELPGLPELHRSLREAGILLDVQRLQPAETATSVRFRDGQAEITDGPFATTKEFLAGYYLVECADREHAVQVAAGLSGARHGRIEVRPVIPPAEWDGDDRP